MYVSVTATNPTYLTPSIHQLFDDNGRPRRQKNGMKGCHRDASDCHFVHPHEREWKTALSSHPPKPELVLDSDSDFYYIVVGGRSDRTKDHRDWERQKERDRDREKERERDRKQSSSFHSESPLHRKDSTRGSPRSSSRRSTFDSVMDGSGATKRPRSPALSVSSDHLERLLKDNRDKGKGRERPDHPNVLSPVGSDISNSRHLSAVPPEPPKPPPTQPPPPPPPVPELGRKHVKGLKDLSMDEQRQAWHERIDLMFTSITARRDYAKLETELSHLRQFSDSSLINNMPETNRARIDAQKTVLESQIVVKRKEVNDIIQKLIRSEFWPILRTPQISELEKTLGESKKYVLEVKSVLDDLKNSCAALLKASASEGTEDANRPTKRRKLDKEADAPAQSTTDTAEVRNEDAPRELEGLRDKLTELTGYLSNLENDITQRDAIISDEVELRISNWLEEEEVLYPPVKEPGEVSQAEIRGCCRREEPVAGEEISMLAVEVAELITKVDALEARCKALEVENEEFKIKITQDALQHVNYQEALTRREKEVEAIAAALQAYIAQVPTSQSTEDLPSPEYIIQSLDTQLDGLFRKKFTPTLTNFQREVIDKVQESHDRTMTTVTPKIMLLVKMVNLITARLGRPNMDAVDTDVGDVSRAVPL
ncbi:hypothetical protein JVU11DRAFT_584 [Chiua virens]|nr:hypothetical protein JVU11DRAFT_584 [Chiua virens]